jgi:hypothetical protein
MNAELKQKWVTALRSGEYKQAQKRLKVGDAYCCLGVLCHIAGYRIIEKDDMIVAGEHVRDYRVLGDLGLDPDLRQPLITMNDDGKTFGEIAAYIEFNL